MMFSRASAFPSASRGKPLALLSLMVFFLRRKVLRERVPLIASFKITHQCNLACQACPFHRRENVDSSAMTWQQALVCLEDLEHRGCRIVIFEGGEPLLWKDGEHTFADLAMEAGNRFLRVGVTTNGTFPLDVPVDLMWVSLDGLKSTHDLMRSNSFDRAWRNLSGTEHGNVLIHVTINRENCSELETLVTRVTDLPTIRGVTLQLFYPYNQGEAPLALSPSERKTALESAIALKKAGYPILNSAGQLKAMIENTWRCHDDMLINVDPNGDIVQGCYVKSRGDVRCTECGFTPVAEASGALDLRPGSLLAGWNIFFG